MADIERGPNFSERQSNRNESAQSLCNDAYSGFQGLDLGIIKLGSQNCSGVAQLDIGIFKGGVSAGQHTGVGAELGVPGARAGFDTGVSVNERGAKAGFNAGAELGPVVGADVGVGASIGKRSGIQGGADAYLGPLDIGAGGGAYLDKRGLHGRAGGGAELDGVGGGGGRVKADIGQKTGVEVRNQGYIGNTSSKFEAGAQITPRPKAYIKGDINPHSLY